MSSCISDIKDLWRLRFVMLAVVLFLAWGVNAATTKAGDITYNLVNYPFAQADDFAPGRDTISGKIVTDGTIGLLTAGTSGSSIISATFTITAPNGGSYTLTNPNLTVESIYATPTQILAPLGSQFTLTGGWAENLEISYAETLAYTNSSSSAAFDGLVTETIDNPWGGFPSTGPICGFNTSFPALGGAMVIASTPQPTWTRTSNGSWTTPGNWSNNAVPSGVGQQAALGAAKTPITVTLDSTQTLGSLTFNGSANYTLAAGTSGSLTLDNTGGLFGGVINVLGGVQSITAPLVIANSGAIVSLSGSSLNTAGIGSSRLNISGNISEAGGSQSLTVSADGTGVLVLSGSNTYTGGTTISPGGFVIFSNRAAQPSSGTTTVALAGTVGFVVGSAANLYAAADLDAVFAGKMPNVSSDPNSNVAIDTTAGDFTYSSNIPATGLGLTKMGSNTLTLTGSNSYSGLTTINAGTLQVGDGTAGHDGSLPNFNVVNNAALVFNLNGSETYAGQISGSGTMTKNGPGTLALMGYNNSYSGDTLINSGALNLAYSSAIWNSTVVVSSSAALTFASGVTSPTLGGLAGAGNIALATAAAEPVTLNVGQNGQNTTYSGILSGGGGLAKQGTGILTLTAGQSFKGPTLIAGGVLALQPTHGGSIGINFEGSNNVRVTGSAGAAAMTDWNNLTGDSFSNKALTDNSGAKTTASLTITDASGDTSSASSNPLFNGYLWIGSHTQMSATISGIPYRNYDIYAYLIDATSGYGEKVTIGGQTYYFSPSNNPTYAQITNTTPGTYQKGNYVVASGTASSQTISVQGITAQYGSFAGFEIVSTAVGPSANLLPITTPVSIANGTTLDLGGANQQIASLSDVPTSGSASGNIINSNPGVESVLTLSPTSGTSTFSGHIQGGGGLSAISVVMSGSGTQVLSGTSSYTGGTTIGGGTLAVTNEASLGALSGSLSIGPATLEVTSGFSSPRKIALTDPMATIQVDAKVTYVNAGAISGTGGLNQSGGGTLVLEGSDSYTGGTVVSNGTLVLDGASSLAAGSGLTIGNGGAGQGGIFVPDVARNSSQAVAPVPEPGTSTLLAIAALAGLANWRRRKQKA